MSDSPELSIVMPCLNEARTLPFCLEKAQSFLTLSGVKGELIVADNGSSDSSVTIAQNHGARVVTIAKRGYGAALTGGIAAAHGRYIIVGDADNSYDFLDLMPLLEKLRAGNDLVVGNRFKGGIEAGAMPFLNRYIGNPLLSFLGRLFFNIPLRDFHCGLRGFTREAFARLDLQTTGMEFASEMIVRAAFMGLSLAEVPVTLSRDGRDRKPHLHPWRDGWRHLRFLLLYSPRWLFVYPGLALIVLGLLVSLVLLPGPVMIAEGVGLDVHTLLVAAAGILVGVQSLTFGAIARVYAKSSRMIPCGTAYDRWLGNLKLEHLLVVAGLLILCGLGAVALAAHKWSNVDFGALDYRDAMRILIVAITCLVGGLQLGFAAFLLGVMKIERR